MAQKQKHKRDGLVGGNPKILRNINRAIILNIIREREPIPRVRIAQLTNLNKSTVSSIVASLIREDLVFENEDRNQGVGRNPLNLHLKLGRHFVGAINIDSSTTRVAISDIDGEFKEYSEIETRPDDPEEFVTLTIAELKSLQQKGGVPSLEGIGVTIAGIVDPVHGRVVYAPRLKWEDREIGKLYQQAFPDLVVHIENDAKALALAELWFGTQRSSLSDFVFLSVGPGIGTGVVVDRKLMIGKHSAAGEFGHISLKDGGEACSCGNRGCWEAYASDYATVSRYCERKKITRDNHHPVMLQDVIDHAGRGDADAIQTLRETGQYLGMGIVNILKAVDPEVVVVGGRIVQSWDMIYPDLMNAVTERAFHARERTFTIVPTSLKVRPWLIGAATLAIREIFKDYQITV